jgi:hypothetical protein
MRKSFLGFWRRKYANEPLELKKVVCVDIRESVRNNFLIVVSYRLSIASLNLGCTPAKVAFGAKCVLSADMLVWFRDNCTTPS